MSQPTPDLERRLTELEAELRQLQRGLAEQRDRNARRARRDRWARIAFWILVGGAYVLYLRRVTDLV